jgi:hypothetical protein
MGAAKQSASPLNTSSWASNRGFGYRTFLQILNWLSDQKNSESIGLEYQFNLKLFTFLLFVMLILFCILLLSSNALLNSWSKKLWFFSILFIVLFSVSNTWVSMQPDYLTALVGILIVCLIIQETKVALFVAGILLGLTFSFKGVTILTGFSAVAISQIFYYKKSFRFIVTWISYGIISSAILLTLYLVKNPLDLKDLNDATTFQGTFLNFNLGSRIWISLWCIFKYWSHVPVIILIPFLAYFVLAMVWRSKRACLPKLTAIFLSLFIGFVQIFIQGSGYGYNLAVFIPCAFGLITFLLQNERSENNLVSLVFLLIIAFITSPLVPKYMWDYRINESEYNLSIHEKYHQFERLKGTIDAKCKGKILYLDDGLSAYFLKTTSASRYTHPLQLYREFDNPKFVELQNEFLSFLSITQANCALVDPALLKSKNVRVRLGIHEKLAKNFEVIDGIENVVWLFKQNVN